VRFIGSKERLLSKLDEIVIDLTGSGEGVFADLFAGTATVSKHFKRRGYSIISSDTLFFSYVMQKTYIENNSPITFDKLFLGIPEIFNQSTSLVDDVFSYLNLLEGKEGFCFENYSPGGAFDRRYFTEQNAARVDEIREKIDEWFRLGLVSESEKLYLVCSLIEAVPFVSNISGTYGSYLKMWDRRAFKRLELTPPKLVLDRGKSYCFQRDANEVIKDIECDVLYLDPPYNNRQYISNYHVLETISRNDKPTLRGRTGLRFNSKELLSRYCKKQEANAAFEELLSEAVNHTKHVVISYNSEGIVSSDCLENILRKVGFAGVHRIELPLARFKSNSNGDQPRTVFEYVFVGRGKTRTHSSSLLKESGARKGQLSFGGFESTKSAESKTNRSLDSSEVLLPNYIKEKELDELLKQDIGTGELDHAKRVFGESIEMCYSELKKKLNNRKRLSKIDDSKSKTPFLDLYGDRELLSLPNWLREQISDCVVIGSSSKVIMTPDGKKYHMGNRLNDLCGAEWTYFLNSVITTRYPVSGDESYAHEIRKIHPSPKPPQLMREIIEFFTKEQELVLDYFMGVGGTLLGASLCNRKAIGIDLNKAFIDAYERASDVLGLRKQTTLVGDSLELMDRQNGKLSNMLESNSLGMVLIDPPYGDMMSRKKTGDSARRRRDTSATPFSESSKDLGNLEYDAFLERLRLSVEKAVYYLRNKRYVVVFAKDLQPMGKNANITHADIIRELNKIENIYYSGMKIWADYTVSLYPYGYPYSFVANQVHQYILIFQKRD